jgi:hypothetical protein
VSEGRICTIQDGTVEDEIAVVNGLDASMNGTLLAARRDWLRSARLTDI